MTLRMFPRVHQATNLTDKPYIDFIGNLHHFTRLQVLAIKVAIHTSEEFELWESIGALISTGLLNPGLKILSIHFTWTPPLDSINSDTVSSAIDLALRKAEILDPLLENSFEQLSTLSLDMSYTWPSNLRDEGDHWLRTRFSQPAIEDALRKKLPKISQKIRLNVSVSHYWR